MTPPQTFPAAPEPALPPRRAATPAAASAAARPAAGSAPAVTTAGLTVAGPPIGRPAGPAVAGPAVAGPALAGLAVAGPAPVGPALSGPAVVEFAPAALTVARRPRLRRVGGGAFSLTLGSRAKGDAGMTTAEYAVGTVAACGFAGVLWVVIHSGAVSALLQGVVERALHLPF